MGENALITVITRKKILTIGYSITIRFLWFYRRHTYSILEHHITLYHLDRSDPFASTNTYDVETVKFSQVSTGLQRARNVHILGRA